MQLYLWQYFLLYMHLSGQFNLLSDLSMFAIWAFYTLTFIGVIKLRKTQPDLKRPYKVPFYPVIPIISICSGLFVVIDQLFLAGMKSSMISLGGVIITLIGLPVYSFMTKNKPELQEENKAAIINKKRILIRVSFFA